MGIGSAADSPYGNGGQIVNDMIGEAYATVKLVAVNMTALVELHASTADIIASGDVIANNIVIIQNAVTAGNAAIAAAAEAEADRVSVNGLVVTATASQVAAANSAAAAAASALLASNIAGGNFLAQTGGVVTGNIDVTGYVTVANLAYAVGWNGNFQVPTRNDVYDAMEALRAEKISITSIGVANGVVPTGGDNKISVAFLPDAILGAMKFQSTWNANTNIPAIPAAAVGNKGHYYIVATAGATMINGVNEWAIGDWLVSDGANWNKIDSSDKVSSVNGQTGVVVLGKADVGLNNVDNTADANKPVSAAQAAAIAAAKLPTGQTVANQATITPTFADDYVVLTGQAQPLAVANPTGAGAEEWGISIRIKDNGIARAINWGAQYRAIGEITIPVTTVANKWLRIGILYNATDVKWDVVAVLQEV